MGDRTRFSCSAFSPAAARQTSVCLKSTEVLRINLRTGRLELENDAIAESSYANESEALIQLQCRGFELVERGCALLGFVAAGPAAGVLLATRVREKAVLPGGHTVYAVTDSQWLIVPLQNEAADAAQAAALAGLPPPRSGDVEFWRALQQFTLNNAHYYCETADISRPFPSDKDPREPAAEFVWNSWLRQPLVELGLYEQCPSLLQGAVECSTLAHPGGGRRFSMCLVSRRSRRHPGTRYIARGLNSMAGPGNEIECELLTWTHPEQQYYAATSYGGGTASLAGGLGAGGEALKWARVVWRRGTVPIWWGVQLQSLAQGLQAEVYVREEHPYQGTASYFRNVQRQHAPRPMLPHPSAAAAAGAGGEAGGSGGGAAADGGSAAGGGSSEGWTLVEDGSTDGSGSAAAAAAAGAAAGAAQELGPAEQQQGQQAQQAQQQQQQQHSGCEGGGLGVPVTCINLLHANPKKASELMLSSHFQDAMRHVRRRLGGQAPIQVVNFDWHGNMGRLSEEKAVEGFWSLMEPFVKHTGFASGWMEAGGGGEAAGPGAAPATAWPPAGPGAAPATAWPPGWRMRWDAQQAGLLRFNCADSLDRTNAATCFAMLPVLQEQLRVLGVVLEYGVPPATAALLRSRQRSSAGDMAAVAGQQPGAAAEDAAAVLPEGWEVRQHEGRLLYIDHINRATQWTPPPSPATSQASGGSPGTSGRPPSAGRPPSSSSSTSSAAPLSARMIQSASDMLARLQRQTASPGPAAPRAAPALDLERRSSPPRAMGGLERVDGGAPGQAWARSGSAGSLNGGGGGGSVPHAASAPDVSLAAASHAATASATTSDAPDRDPARPWAFFDYDINDVRERLFRDAVSDYVEMFRVHGDIHSFLYTGSPAMHSHVLNLVVQGGKGYGATSGVGKLQNLRVAVQRRWNNTVSDTSRQQAMELFLGLRIHDGGGQKGYFPGLQVVYRDSTQPLLGGMEAFEAAPLPPLPASHSRHASGSAVPGAFGPLAAGAPAAGAAALQQQQEAGQGPASLGEQEECDRAHAVPGVPAVEHDGVLGVRQSLLDLEPLSDLLPEQQQQQQAMLPGGEPAARGSGSSSLVPGGGSGGSGSGGEPWAPPLTTAGAPSAAPPAAAFDPLGAVGQPGAPAQPARQQQQQQMDELISLDDDRPATAAAQAPLGSAPASGAVRSQLEDLLL
ncbi:hypothetical protein CHLNCDRAFT_133330 [Chlorella variabilis]|uniref:WW domain-containing protein n=1 Tax=Chlorella variabilis TaxID=554065 RepID=E1Z2V9_CHLVA|nr:hypothetical protein CHLNCDRAFT_133330 [Chlorella variabilis]EFN60062.1 hypothetical protein CHLNCDRAFT_133330 [Chlorella variabilis]|eukprot:XP_005852164.1 hypothetical protein CHLNCDRAFT_133330 [Chlorella variabilis]